MAGGEQHDGPRKGSNERISDTQPRRSRRGNVVEERAGHHGPNDRRTKIYHDQPARRVEERLSDAANGNSEQYEDNE